MTKTRLRESQVARKGRALLITAGLGSSGSYSAEVLQRDGAAAFPSGTFLYYNHLGESEEWERRGSHDVKDIVGVTKEAATWNEELAGLEAPVEIFPHAQEFVEAVWEHIGLSVESAGVISDDGVVEALIPSPLNAIALVPVAGRGGKIQGLFEGYRERYGSISDDEPDKKEDTGMTPEDKQEIVEAVVAGISGAMTELKESLKPVEVEPKDKDESEDTAAVAEALVEAKLPASARAKVYEAVKGGAKVADAIAAEKAYIADVLKESNTGTEEVAGRVKESGTVSGAIKAWG